MYLEEPWAHQSVGVFRWGLGEEEGWVSFAGPRRSCSRAEEDRSYEFHGELGSPACGLDGGGVLERGSEENAKGRGERVARLLVVLLRARNRALGLCLGRAMATARWRPAATSGWRGNGKRGPARGVEAVERSSATRGCQRKQEVPGEAAQSGGRRCAGEQASRAGKQAGGGRI